MSTFHFKKKKKGRIAICALVNLALKEEMREGRLERKERSRVKKDAIIILYRKKRYLAELGGSLFIVDNWRPADTEEGR